MGRIEEFNKLKEEIKNCRICSDYFGFIPRPYFFGRIDSKIVQISQAPSKMVHYSGKPFNDKSGERLREWYEIDEETFYDERIFYMTSLSHCYPGKNNNRDNKPPLICAKKFLLRELKLIENEIYIIVGSMAAKFLFPNQDFTYLVFNSPLNLNNKPAYIIPHPSPQNIRWLKQNPEFYESCLPNLQKVIKRMVREVKNGR